MSKFIALIIGSIVIVLGGVAAYYFSKQPSKEMIEFAQNYENMLNQGLDNIEEEIASLYDLRNMLKLKSKPFVCNASKKEIRCISSRLYIGAPFSSYDTNENIISISFDTKNNTFYTEVKVNGVFELEQNSYTNAVKYNAGIECSSLTKYIPEEGALENAKDNCKSYIDTIEFDTTLNYAYKSEDLVDKNIYDAALEFYSSDNMDRLFNIDKVNVQGMLTSFSFSISSAKGLLNNIHEYITAISKAEISKADIIGSYKELREELLDNIKRQELYEEDKYIFELAKNAINAFDGVILNNDRTLRFDINAKSQPKYYTIEDIENIEEIMKEYNFKMKSMK